MRNAQVIKRIIATSTKRTAVIDFAAASAPKTGPMVLKPTTCIELVLDAAFETELDEVAEERIVEVEVEIPESPVESEDKAKIMEFFCTSVRVAVRISYSFVSDGMTEAGMFNGAIAA